MADEQQDHKEHREHKFIKGVVYRIASKYIAGSTLSSILQTIRDNDSQGLKTTVTFLNDDIGEPAKARYNANSYSQLARQASRLNLNADISVRLSQMGMALNNGIMDKCISDILKTIDNKNILWLEFESDPGFEGILSIYRKYRKQYGNIGVEVPISYPMESATIRRYFKPKDTVKLTYYHVEEQEKREEREKKKKNKKDKPENNGAKSDESRKKMLNAYALSIAKLLQEGANVTVLESDEKLISKLANVSKEYKKSLIFELPLGYNKRWLNKLIKMKINLSVYAPYGKDWSPYIINKLTKKHEKIRDITARFLTERSVEDEES